MTETGFVYMVAVADGHRKVGTSRDPVKRALTLQTSHPQRMHLEGMWSHRDPYAVEREVHRALKSCRVSGEWFLVTRTSALEVILAALKTVPGGLLDYEDQPLMDLRGRTPRGAQLKLVGPLLDVAKQAWADPNLTATQAIEVVRKTTGARISLRTLWTHLGKKSDAEAAISEPIKVAPVTKPKPKRRKRRIVKKEKSLGPMA